MANITKKLINEVSAAVDDNLEGYVNAHAHTQQLKANGRVIIRSDLLQFKQSGKVALICGGGSGHEPVFAGYVGKGCLTAAIAGSVFASPPSNSILQAIEAVANPTGTIVFVYDYTGDRLNFGVAVERAKMLMPDNKVRMIVLHDDAAPIESNLAGRRGLAGCCMILKMAGAMSEMGKSVNDIVAMVEHSLNNLGTIGVSLSSCSLPGSGPLFKIESNEIEVGLGVHGEPGVERRQLTSAQRVIDQMMHIVTDAHNEHAVKVVKSMANVACAVLTHIADHQYVVLLNNLGGMTNLEMNIVCKQVLCWCANHHIDIQRFYVGPVMTSLEMQGLSISLLNVDSPDMIHLLDANTECSAWPKSYYCSSNTPVDIPLPHSTGTTDWTKMSSSCAHINEVQAKIFEQSVRVACEAMIKCETKLNELDAEAGDGDCGTTMLSGSNALLSHLSTIDFRHPTVALQQMAQFWEAATGGTTGAIYSLLFSSAAHQLHAHTDYKDWMRALQYAMQTVTHYSLAKKGDRTLLDSLYAFSQACIELNVMEHKQNLIKAVEATEQAAEATAHMRARAGRASYVDPKSIHSPDPGAIAVAIWMRAICDFLISPKH